MSRPKLLFSSLAILALFLVSTYALAQGCGAEPGIVQHWNCPGYDCVSQQCVVGGPPGYYCSEGYGECCSQDTFSANDFLDQSCCEPQQCPAHFAWNPIWCRCELASPIVIDTTGEGFHLTSAEDGVVFDILGTGYPVRIAWTAGDSRNAISGVGPQPQR
jgi:hypothetical protein